MSKKKRPREGRPRSTPAEQKVKRDDDDDDGVVLWRIVTDHPDIFNAHILPKLKVNGRKNDFKFFYHVNRESRAAIKRSRSGYYILPNAFKIEEFETKSTLSWALERCSEKKERFCQKMAEKVNVELLEFLRGEGCPWDKKTCSLAAENGHLECLKYAHENG